MRWPCNLDRSAVATPSSYHSSLRSAVRHQPRTGRQVKSTVRVKRNRHVDFLSSPGLTKGHIRLARSPPCNTWLWIMVCPTGQTKQRTIARPKPKSAQSAPPRASRHLATITMQATRQIMILGRYTTNVERNVLISSALFIGQGGCVYRERKQAPWFQRERATRQERASQYCRCQDLLTDPYSYLFTYHTCIRA